MERNTAVLIDGGFLVNTFMGKFSTEDHKAYMKAEQVIKNAHKICPKEQIFRIYYYDCAPYGGKERHPVSGHVTDYSKTAFHIINFQSELARSERLAFRKGLLRFEGWKFAKHFNVFNFIQNLQSTIEAMKGATIEEDKTPTLSDKDIVPSFEQKRVDIKIGLDIAWLSLKKIVTQIIIVTSDSDFIPVMKFARKEGVQVILCSISGKFRQEMLEHCDEFIELNLVK